MTQEEFNLFCLVLLTYLKILNAAFIPLIPLIPSTSTYKPSTLLLPPGFESQNAPPQPMLYPYAVSSAAKSTGSQLKIFSSPTPDWMPVALNVNSDLHLKRNTPSTTPTPYVPVLKDRISHDEPKYSSPAYKEGPVFESIVYGTWKPDPPLQPLQPSNATTYQHFLGSKSNTNSTAIANGNNLHNKTINRQHGGFIGTIQKPFKIDRQVSLTTPSLQNKTIDSIEPKISRKVKKQGRRKIQPNGSTAEQNSIPKSQEVATARTTTTTKAHTEPHQNVIKVNATDPKLMEVVKQINESLEIKYNHKQTSTHSIDMMVTTAEANNDNDESFDYSDGGRLDISNVQWGTKANEFLSTEPQFNYDDDEDDDDYTEKEIRHINATRRSWPTDFIEEPLTTTLVSYQSVNTSGEVKFNHRTEADPSEIPLALSALNIPPSLWPKLPGNITKLGKPYEAESSAEEPALCVPITVREQNIMNTNELIYIERIFCFPMPPSTTSEKSFNILENTSTRSTTYKTFTTTKVQNFDDFVDTHPRASKANNFKNNLFLVVSFLIIYLKYIYYFRAEMQNVFTIFNRKFIP